MIVKLFCCVKKQISVIYRFVAICMVVTLSLMSVPVFAENGSEYVVTGPEDLTFRKFYTGRGYFDSELPISKMNFKDAYQLANGMSFESFDSDKALLAINNTDEKKSVYLPLDDMKVYGSYDIDIIEQEPALKDSAQSYSTAEMIWKKNDDNFVSISRNVVGTSQTDIYENLFIEDSLDMLDSDLLESASVYHDNGGGFTVSKVTEGIRFSNTNSSTRESYVGVAPLRNGAVLEVDVLEQNTHSYMASAIMKLRYNNTTNGIQIIQRAATASSTNLGVYMNNGSGSGEISVIPGIVEAPYTLRVRIEGSELKISRIKDGIEGAVASFNTANQSYGFNLADESVLSKFEFTFGGRLGTNESVIYTGVRQYVNDSLISSDGLTLMDEMIMDNSPLSPDSVHEDNGSGIVVTKNTNGLTLSRSGSTVETYVDIAPLRQNAVLEADVSSQVRGSYYASAIMKLRYNNTSSGIQIIQRGSASSNYQIGIYMSSETGTKLAEFNMPQGQTAAPAISTPYTIRVRLEGKLLKIYRVKDNVENYIDSFDPTAFGGYDLSDADTLSKFTFTAGGRLGNGDSITYSGLRQYVSDNNLYALDMQDDELLSKTGIYNDGTNNPVVSKVENGIKFTGASGRGEAYVPVGPAAQKTIVEVTVSNQTRVGYSDNAIVKLRNKTENNAQANGLYLAQRHADHSDKNLTLELFDKGSSKSNQVISTLATRAPYTLRMWIVDNVVFIDRVVNGEVTASGSLNVGEYWDLANPDVIKNFEFCIGARTDPNESVTYSQAVIKPYNEIEKEDIIRDDGIVLKVKQNGVYIIDEVLPYPAQPISAPYTLRAHWTGQYINVWALKDGTPIFLGTKDLGSVFNMLVPSVISGFKAYAGITLSPGSKLSIGSFHSYYSGGNGQADPRPLHKKDGTILVEDGKIYLEMTIRGYSPIPCSAQGIYSLDLSTLEMKLVSVVVFDKGDSDGRLWGFHASDFIYDEDIGRWIVVTSSHGSDKKLRFGLLDPEDDPRVTPFIIAKVKPLQFDTIDTRGNIEDPSMVFDRSINRWRILTCYSGFRSIMLVSTTPEWDSDYEEWGIYDFTSTTGNTITSVAGKLYGFIGRSVGAANMPEQCNLEVLELPSAKGGTLKKISTLNIDATTDSYNPWATVMPIEDNETGVTKYYLLTFDRDYVANNSSYSYGRLFLYEADQIWSEEELPQTPTASIPGENVNLIRNADDLYAIRGNLNGNYTLGNNIDMSGTNWFPIGTPEAPFTGQFNGNGYTITNIKADLPSLNYVGLFGYTAPTAKISNVTLTNANMNGRIYTGGVVGYNTGIIENVVVYGKIQAYAEGGLLAGRNATSTAIITDCAVYGTVTGENSSSIGGFVGNNANGGTISLSSSAAAVRGSLNVGGFVGYNDRGIISDCYATGNTMGTSFVGGFVGASGSSGYIGNGSKTQNPCSISRSYASGDVSGKMNIGGFAGFNDKDITDCFATGTVAATDKNIGGFVGKNNQYGVIKNSFAGTVTTTSSDYAGSIIGSNYGNFNTIGYTTLNPAPIGNSKWSELGIVNPSFTDVTTFEQNGVLQSWNTEEWIIENGKLPTLKKSSIFTDGNGTPITSLTSETITATIDYTNQLEISKDLTLYLAIYSPDETLIHLATDNKIIETGETTQFKATLHMPLNINGKYATEGYTASAFLWDENIAPFISKTTLP